jgi:hypothetical protein
MKHLFEAERRIETYLRPRQEESFGNPMEVDQ